MIQNVSAKQAEELISRGDVEVIDVRDPGEWSNGHIPGARLIPLAQLQKTPKSVLTRDSVLFVCAAGVRSQTAARIAAAQGLSRVYSLSTGTRGWVNAGYPLVNDLSVAV